MRRSVLMLIACLSSFANAKDLAHRMGIGFTDQFGLDSNLPSIALRYFPNQEYGIAGAIGVDTQKDNSRFGAQAKIMKIIFKEDNLNFYTGAAAGIISRELNGKTNSGFDLAGFIGTEFF